MYIYLYSPNLKVQAKLQIQLLQFRKLRDLTVEAAVGRKHYNYQFGFTSSPFHRNTIPNRAKQTKTTV